MVPWVMTDQILLGGKGTAKHVPPRDVPACWPNSRAQHTGWEQGVLSWFSKSGKKPDVTRAGRGEAEGRGHWVSNTVRGLPRQPLGSPFQGDPGADGQKRKTYNGRG